MNDLATAAVADVPSGTWQIDSAHSVIGFSVGHLMSKVRGTFDEFTGDLTIADDRGRSAATIDIAMTSVNTGHDMRDDDLRTSNFFDVAQHPTMTYASTGLREADGSISASRSALPTAEKVVVGDKVDISLDVEAFLNGGN